MSETCTCVVGICREDETDGCCESPHCPATKPNHDYLGRRDADCGCCCVVDTVGLEHLIDDLEAARAKVERVRALADEWESGGSPLWRGIAAPILRAVMADGANS